MDAKHDRHFTEGLYSPVSDNRKEPPCSACCRRATEELERKLNKIRLKYAEIKAQKGALISSEKKLIDTLNLKKSRLEQTEEALNRLKTKSRSLLRQYRAKKQMVSSISTKVEAIRSNLLDLKDLCKTKDENYKEILSHFGGQIEISARLLANYLNVPINLTGYNVNLKSTTKSIIFSTWFCDVQSLSTWTHAQLTAFGTRLWMGREKCPETVIKEDIISKKISTQVILSTIMKGEESFSSKLDKLDAIQKQISEADTMSEISHTLECDEDIVYKPCREKPNTLINNPPPMVENTLDPTTVKAIVHAQDIIAKTQKEHFDNLLTSLEKTDFSM